MILKLTGKLIRLNTGTYPSAMLLFNSCCGLVRDWPELNPYIVSPDTKEAGRREGSEFVQGKRFFTFLCIWSERLTNDH